MKKCGEGDGQAFKGIIGGWYCGNNNSTFGR